MDAYDRDLRKRVLAAYLEDGMETAEVAETYHVSPAWARRLKQRFRELGTIDPLPQKHGPDPTLDQNDLQLLSKLIADKPDLSLAELCDALAKATRKPPGSVPTMCRATRKLGLTRKKSPRMPASRKGRT